jgi:hypothetical protein
MGRSTRGSASLARLDARRGGVDPALRIIADCGQRCGEPAPPPLHGISILTVEAE